MVKSVKLADIAEKMNVSVVTVSKALSGQKGVSEQMRVRIKEMADEMGYVPIHSAQKAKSKSYTIGVVSFESYFMKFASFYWKMYQEFATRAVRKNCFTMLEVISSAAEKSHEPPKLLSESRVDGVVIIGKPIPAYLKMLGQYRQIPMVFMDFYDDDEDIDSVISAGFNGAYKMTNYLLKMGHTQIAYVGTLMYTESITDRYLGYCKALMEHGIERRSDWIINDRNPYDGRIGMDYKFTLPDVMPTAFFCNNDVSAYALIKTLEKKGYRVPDDVSVAGYDDYLYPEFGSSEITTYAVDMGEMSRIALSCLIKKLENTNYSENLHIVPGKIIVRGSVRNLNEG